MQTFLAQQAPPLQGFLSSIFPLAVILVIFYLLVIMPQRRRQKKLEELIGNLKNGDRVITTSGIYGTIAGIKENTFHVKIADQVKIEVSRNAIAGLQVPDKRG